MIRAVALDVGETIVRDDRYWSSWADWFDIPRHTLSALVGAVVAQGRDNADAIRLLRPGVDLAAEYAAREEAGRGEVLTEEDLYPDVRPALAELRELGVRVIVAGNQTARAGELLREMNLPADAVATSGEWGVAKPGLGFFRMVVGLSGVGDPGQVLYVGDHPVNDVQPAREAGLRTAHLRRGPWGYLWAEGQGSSADWSIDGLSDLVGIVKGTQ